MKEEEKIQALVDEVVSSFRRFQEEAMATFTKRGVPVSTMVDVLSRSMYECLFASIHFSMKLSNSAVTGPMIGHKKALLDHIIHEEVARRISNVMLEALERTHSRYRWRVVIMKQERELK